MCYVLDVFLFFGFFYIVGGRGYVIVYEIVGIDLFCFVYRVFIYFVVNFWGLVRGSLFKNFFEKNNFV